MAHFNCTEKSGTSPDLPDRPNQTEARLAAIFAQAEVGLSEISLEGRFQHVNNALCLLLGRSRSELLASAVPDITHPDDIPKSLSALQRLIETGEPAFLDKRYLRPDGSLVYANSALTRLDDEQGRPQAVLAVTVDLTERRLCERNAFFRAEVHRDLAQLTDPDEIMRNAAQNLCRHLMVSNVTLLEVNDNQSEATILHQEHNGTIVFTSGSHRLTDFMSPTAIRELAAGETIAVDDVHSDGPTAPFLDKYQALNISSLACSPFISQGNWRFLLAIKHHRPRHWHPDEIALIADLAAGIFVRLERSRAEAARKALHERLALDLADMQRLQETSTRLIAEGDVQSLLDEILASAIAFCHADSGTIQLVNPEMKQLRLLASRGLTPSILKDFGSLSPDDVTTCVAAWNSGGRVIAPDLKNDQMFIGTASLEVHRQAGIMAAQSTPLVSRSGQLLGIISTHWKRPHQPMDRELDLLDLLARQAADLIERHQAEEALRESESSLRELSRSLEERVQRRTLELQEQTVRLRHLAAELVSAEQRERKRLAAMLHDELQQLLVASTMRIQSIIQRVADPESRKAAQDALTWIAEATDAARDLTRQLRPPVLYENGLLAALNWLASDMFKRHSLSVIIDAPDCERHLNDETKALLFECVRELLFNTAKYAGVNAAAVTMRDNSDSLTLIVADAGCGFDPDLPAQDSSKHGFGLFSIRERLTALSGKMIIQSSPSNGTTIELTLPRKEAEFGPTGGSGASPPQTCSALLEEKPLPHPANQGTRVMVVEDHALVREGIANRINQDERLCVIAEASDGIAAIEAMEMHQPDMVLMDLNMPRMNGIEAMQKIHRRWPGTLVIGLSVQDDEGTANSTLAAGAAAFISKSADSERMISTILALASPPIRGTPDS